MDGPDAAALFILIGMAFIEDHAVAGLELGGTVFEFDHAPLGGGVDEGADVGAAGLGEAGGDELLMVQAAEEAVGKATGEGLFEVEFLLGVDGEGLAVGGGIQGEAIGLGGGGDVGGGLEAAFDFKAGDASLREIEDEVVGGKILRGEEIGFIAEVFHFAIDDKIVGEAAGLGTLATIGTAAAEGFAGEALAGISDAEGAVNEDFHGEDGGARDFFDFWNGELAGEDDAFHAEGFDEADAAGFGEGHLGGAVDGEGGAHLVDELNKAEILDDDGIDAGGGDLPEVGGGFGEFGGEDQGVEGEVGADVVFVEVAYDFREIFGFEVGGAVAGVEVGEAEIDGIGPVDDGGDEGFPIAGGGEEFGDFLCGGSGGELLGAGRGRDGRFYEGWLIGGYGTVGEWANVLLLGHRTKWGLGGGHLGTS